MEDKIKNFIKEEVHAILEIEEISKNLAKHYMKRLNYEAKELVNDKQNTNWFCYPSRDLYLSNNIFINELTICIYNYKFHGDFSKNHVTGSFSDKVFQKTVDNIIKYDSGINIKIYNWDFKTDLTKQMEDVFSHELHHVFDAAIRFNKKSNSKILNSIYKRLKLEYPDFIKSSPFLKEFMDVFYLNLPEERNARIHLLHIEAKKLKGLSRDEMIIKLSEFAPYKDFQRMYNLIYNDLSVIPLEEKKRFVEYFNQILKKETINKHLEKDNIQYPNDPEKFFEFWIKQFRVNAEKLFKDAKSIVNHLTKNQISESIDSHFLDGLSDEAIFAMIGQNFNEYDEFSHRFIW